MNWSLFQNSLLVSTGAALAALLWGVTAALFVSGLGARWRAIVLALAVVAIALPPFLVTNTWMHLLGQTGAWRPWLPLNIYTPGGAVWILSLLLWPVPLFFTLAAWAQIPPSQVESDGALTGAALLRWILVPSARTPLFEALMITWVLALGNFSVPAILQINVFPAELWIRFSTNLDFVGAALLSLPLVLPPAALALWLRRRPLRWPRLEPALAADLLRRRLGRWWWGSAGVASLLLILGVCLPVVELANSPRTWSELPGAWAAGGGALWASFHVAALTATLAAGLGLAAWRWSAGQPLWILWLTPGVFLGVVCIFLFNRWPLTPFYQSSGVVILALTLRYAAIGWQGARWARQTLDPDLDDAARLDGASRWELFRRVRWPQIAVPLAALWYVIYLLTLWDVETVLLIVPPGGETLALRIFNLLHYGHNAQVDALCLILLALALAPLAAWQAARTCGLGRALRIPIGAVLAGLLAGCSQNAPGHAPLDSELFARVEVWGTRGVGPGQFSKPRSVTVDRADNVYVVDMTGRVQKFSPLGEWLLAWQMPETDLGKAKGMGLDRDGRVIVVEPHYSRVNHFSTEGRIERQWGAHGTNAGQLAFPRAVGVNSRGELWVSEYGIVERVQRFTPDGASRLAGFGRYGPGPGEFNRPEGLCVDAQDRLFVADSCNHRVQVFADDGQWLAGLGQAGSGSGELSYPYDVAVDRAGNLFVCEFGNSRIQVFDAHHRTREIIGRVGAAPGQFNNPWGIALDSKGNLYVADAGNHRIQKLIRRPGTA